MDQSVTEAEFVSGPRRYHLAIKGWDCERAAKDISLKLETQLCTTHPEVPPRKAEFPIPTKLRIGGWGGPWVANIDYQHCREIFYTTSFPIQCCW